MKKSVKETILSKSAKIIRSTAFKAAGATSFWGCFQPKEPKALKVESKN